MRLFTVCRLQKKYHFLYKTASIDKSTVDLESYFFSLLDWPSTDEHFKPNLSTVDNVTATNVSTCNLFSLWLLYKLICLFTPMSSAIIL